MFKSSLQGPGLELEAVVVPHLDAAYTLARYLTRNDADAQDVVQDAALRAIKYVGGFRGTTGADARAWFLAIVRNTAYTWQQRRGDPRGSPPTPFHPGARQVTDTTDHAESRGAPT